MTSRDLEWTIPNWQSAETPPVQILKEPEGERSHAQQSPELFEVGFYVTGLEPPVSWGTYFGSEPVRLYVTASDVTGSKVIEAMLREIEQLKVRVTELEGQVQRISSLGGANEFIMLRTIPREEAKNKIRALFDAGGTWYYSDIARRLGLDLPQVVEHCQELEQ